MQKRMKLQLFTGENEEVTIPPELEGVSKETALEIMKEAQQQTPSQEPEGTPPAATPAATEGTEPQAGEGKGEPEQTPSAEADSDNKQSGDEPHSTEPQAIPYKRFKEVNDENKATKVELANLRAEMERLRAQHQVTPPAPAQNVPAANGAAQGQQPPSTAVPRELITQLRETALAGALADCGMTAEDFANLDYDEQGPMKRLDFQTAYNVRLNQMMMQANTVVEQQRRQQQQAQTLQQQINQDYDKFANDMKADQSFEAAYDFACNAKFQTLPDYERVALNAAFERANSGRGSAQDVSLVKSYFTNAVAEFKGQSAAGNKPAVSAAPNKVQQTEDKLKNFQAHPRVDQVKGSNSSEAGMTTADLERLVQETDWDKIPENIQQMLLKG